MHTELPEKFIDRLKEIVPQRHYASVMESLSSPRVNVVRINTLKTTGDDIKEALNNAGIFFEEVSWCPEALILQKGNSENATLISLISKGLIYRQGLSSMLPVVFLDPGPGDKVLDMCAAPGSKTTQIAARMGNKGDITALEAIRGRYFKLRSVTKLLGVTNASFKQMDARRFRCQGPLFDKILVDAPCSSEGRFFIGAPKSFAYWSPRKIKEMVQKQRGLLLSAGRALIPGGCLMYSTCTFAPEENEGVVDWFLRKAVEDFSLDSISLPEIETYPSVSEWRGKPLNPHVDKCMRVLPGEKMEGFFIAKFTKRNQ